MNVQDTDNVVLNTQIKRETEKAILIEYSGKDVWLPKSQICVKDGAILIAAWLADKHNIKDI